MKAANDPTKVKTKYKLGGVAAVILVLQLIYVINRHDYGGLFSFGPKYERGEHCPAHNESMTVPRLHEFCGNKTRLHNNWLEMLEVYKLEPSLLVTDAERGYVWMSIPKVASSNWKRMILSDIAGKPFIEKDVHTAINECCILTEKIAHRKKADRYFTFSFIRNPWTRLYSAYRDKIRLWPGFNRFRYIREMLVMLRGADKAILDVTTEFNYKGIQPKISFSEFMKYLSIIDTEEYDMHWTPWFNIVEGCEVKFDFIGKVEDMDRIYHTLKDKVLKNKVELPSVYPTHASRDQVIDAYKTVPRDVIEEVYQRFSIDFIVGGYSQNIDCI